MVVSKLAGACLLTIRSFKVRVVQHLHAMRRCFKVNVCNELTPSHGVLKTLSIYVPVAASAILLVREKKEKKI